MKVVVAIDDSPHSQHLINTIIHRHWPADIEFKLLAVLEVPAADDNEWRNLMLQAGDRRKENAEELCKQARARITEKVPQSHVHIEIREGDPRSEIVRAASDWFADKIILGAHSKEICPHNLMGSVSRGVVAHAPCSVEVVRTKHRTPVKV